MYMFLKVLGREKSLIDHLKFCNRGKNANPLKYLRTSGRDPYPVLPNDDCTDLLSNCVPLSLSLDIGDNGARYILSLHIR